MTKKSLFVLILIVPLLIIITGCGKDDINADVGSDGVALSFADRNRDTAVKAEIGPGVEIVKTKVGVMTVPTKNYGVALNVYGKSGYRFQFLNCSGTPGSLTMKLGTKFMIDNRDNTSHQIGIGSNTYKLSPYDYAIITIEKIGKFNITCDGGGAANVLVQK